MKPPAPDKLPRGLERTFQDGQLRLTYRHHRLAGAFLLMAGFFWMGLLGPSFHFIAGGDSFGLREAIAFFPFAAAAFGFSYVGLAKVFNHTELHLDQHQFQVAHLPFPWFGAVVVPTEEIAKFLLCNDLEPRDVRHNVTQRLAADLRGGGRLSLLRAISDRKAANFILKEMQAHLHEIQSGGDSNVSRHTKVQIL